MMPSGAYGPAFLATENFQVIRRYNTSDLYALFVGNLADRIAGGGDFFTPPAKVRSRAPRRSRKSRSGCRSRLRWTRSTARSARCTRRQVGTYQKKNRPQDRLLADGRGAVTSALDRLARAVPAQIAGAIVVYQSRRKHDMAAASAAALAPRAGRNRSMEADYELLGRGDVSSALARAPRGGGGAARGRRPSTSISSSSRTRPGAPC